MRGRTHSREFKLTIVHQLARSGQPKCAESTIWRQEYDARGEAAFALAGPTPTQALEAKVAELERFCGQLAMENAVLKKPCASFCHTPTCGDYADTTGGARNIYPSSV